MERLYESNKKTRKNGIYVLGQLLGLCLLNDFNGFPTIKIF